MDNKTALSIVERVKQAGSMPLDPIDQIQRNQALKQILRIGLTGLGLGAAGRGVVGLLNRARPNESLAPASQVAMIPLPEKTRDKAASYSHYTSRPSFMPSAFLAALGGTALGWKGIDAILDRRRKQELAQQENDAKEQFQNELRLQFTPKTACALNRLCDELEKRAWPSISSLIPTDDTLGTLQGMYGTYAAATGLGAGLAAFNSARKASKRNILRKAIELQERRRQAIQPPEVFVVPQ